MSTLPEPPILNHVVTKEHLFNSVQVGKLLHIKLDRKFLRTYTNNMLAGVGSVQKIFKSFVYVLTCTEPTSCANSPSFSRLLNEFHYAYNSYDSKVGVPSLMHLGTGMHLYLQYIIFYGLFVDKPYMFIYADNTKKVHNKRFKLIGMISGDCLMHKTIKTYIEAAYTSIIKQYPQLTYPF